MSVAHHAMGKHKVPAIIFAHPSAPAVTLYPGHEFMPDQPDPSHPVPANLQATPRSVRHAKRDQRRQRAALPDGLADTSRKADEAMVDLADAATKRLADVISQEEYGCVSLCLPVELRRLVLKGASYTLGLLAKAGR